MTASEGRLLVGNLDCESEWARERAGVGTRSTRLDLPPAVLRHVSALATLLRVLGHSREDRLWTRVPVNPARLPEIDGIPTPRLVSGRLDERSSRDEVVAWGETRAVARLRTRGVGDPGVDDPAEVARALERADAASRANHRASTLALALREDLALPGARAVACLEELADHLADGGATASPDERWVLKLPLSAAGRGQIRGRGRIGANGTGGFDPAGHRQLAERCLALHGVLIFEPWMPRVEDLGVTGRIDDDGHTEIAEPHRLLADACGRFEGIDLAPALVDDADERDHARLAETARLVAAKLHALGYRGPFGIDAWRYRDAHGSVKLHPLSEVNARLTFGALAQALASRRSSAASLKLRIGRSIPSGAGAPLLLPEAEGDPAAWIE